MHRLRNRSSVSASVRRRNPAPHATASAPPSNAGQVETRRQAAPIVLNDVHSQLNPTPLNQVLRPRNDEELCAMLRDHASRQQPLCVMGARHAMGGQQFLHAGTAIDTSALSGIVDFDGARGQVVVRGGTRWPQLLQWLQASPSNSIGWTIRQKQTGADDFSIGGSIAANIHGRGLRFSPLVEDLEWIDVMRADGSVVRASRNEHDDLFSLVVGGYGLFGVVVSACLRLQRGSTLVRRVQLVEAHEAMTGFDAAIAAGSTYGDFQFAIDPASDKFLRTGIQSCYHPVDGAPDANPRQMGEEGFRRLLTLAHTDPSQAFEEYAAYYLTTDGQRYPTQAQHSGVYLDGYHEAVDCHCGHAGSEMITELYVPRAALPAFLADAGEVLRLQGAMPIYGTLRLVERDQTSFLAWARQPWACIVLNLHVRHEPAHVAQAAATFRDLIDLALARGGTYYLTYHRWARVDQVEAGHPRIREFLRAKRDLDPASLFQSDWYRHMAVLFGEST